MRTPLVAGNWKMHKTVAESRQLVSELLPGLEAVANVENLICPPFTSIASVAEMLKESTLKLGGQNLYWEEQGAFTAEVSPLMLAEFCKYVITILGRVGWLFEKVEFRLIHWIFCKKHI